MSLDLSGSASFAWPNTVVYVAQLCLASWTKEVKGDPECIFFNLNTYQATFISDFFYPTAGIGTGWDADDGCVPTTDRHRKDGQT